MFLKVVQEHPAYVRVARRYGSTFVKGLLAAQEQDCGASDLYTDPTSRTRLKEVDDIEEVAEESEESEGDGSAQQDDEEESVGDDDGSAQHVDEGRRRSTEGC